MVLMQLRSRDINVNNIRCDNTGEHKCLEVKLLESTFRTNLEYTPPGTPQHNGIVESSFRTLYGRVRAILNGAGIHGSMRSSLWAECANIATDLENATSGKDGESSHKNVW